MEIIFFKENWFKVFCGNFFTFISRVVFMRDRFYWLGVLIEAANNEGEKNGREALQKGLLGDLE